MAESQPLAALRQQLELARAYNETVWRHNASGEPIHVPATGRIISSAYEQLRNAAEYAEGRLVLQRAIRRFYRRMLFVVRRRPDHLGQELIVELCLSGYLKNGQFSTMTAESVSKLAAECVHTYGRLRKAHVPTRKAQDWVLAVLSVRTADLLQPDAYHLALTNFAHQQFLQRLPREQFVRADDELAHYELSLYVAVQQALLKSDIDVVRTDILRLFNQTADEIHGYKTWNSQIDKLYTSALTMRLKRIVSKNGAPYRILRELMEETPSLSDIVLDREQFLLTYDHQIKREYRRTKQRMNSGLIKSIIFIFITKSIIGIGIEAPFDLITYGAIALLPLTVNLLFPPLYMASIRLGLNLPSVADAHAARLFIDQLLYGDKPPPIQTAQRTRPYSVFFKAISALFFLIPLGVTVFVLQRLHFNLLQMVIFFVFFSTASFLGFGLGGMIRELKMSRRRVTLLSTLLDFFYLPFIQLGQWLAGRYARINLLGQFLDIAIELPLKSSLRLIRQWIRFVGEKYEEI